MSRKPVAPSYSSLLSLLIIGCHGSATDTSAGVSLSDRIVGTAWSCEWRALAPVDGDQGDVEPVAVSHSLAFESGTLTDDLPEQLRAWAGDDSWRSTVAAQSVYAGITSVDFNLDGVAWTPFSNDEILVEMAGYDGFHLFDVMTIKWDGDGMFYGLQVGLNRSRCTRTSPPPGDTASR